MFGHLSERITSLLIENKVILEENKDIYSYGLRQLFMMILNITITILLGLIFRELWQSILFSVVYIPLRSYAGGYHARTPMRCTLFSTFMVAVALLFMKVLTFTRISILIMLIISSLIIIILSPVEDKNKPLDNIEKIVYKKRTFIILSIEVIITIIMLLLGLDKISLCLVLSITSLSFMLIFGMIKNGLNKQK